jgi:hypothetical protein
LRAVEATSRLEPLALPALDEPGRSTAATATTRTMSRTLMRPFEAAYCLSRCAKAPCLSSARLPAIQISPRVADIAAGDAFWPGANCPLADLPVGGRSSPSTLPSRSTRATKSPSRTPSGCDSVRPPTRIESWKVPDHQISSALDATTVRSTCVKAALPAGASTGSSQAVVPSGVSTASPADRDADGPTTSPAITTLPESSTVNRTGSKTERFLPDVWLEGRLAPGASGKADESRSRTRPHTALPSAENRATNWVPRLDRNVSAPTTMSSRNIPATKTSFEGPEATAVTQVLRVAAGSVFPKRNLQVTRPARETPARYPSRIVAPTFAPGNATGPFPRMQPPAKTSPLRPIAIAVAGARESTDQTVRPEAVILNKPTASDAPTRLDARSTANAVTVGSRRSDAAKRRTSRALPDPSTCATNPWRSAPRGTNLRSNRIGPLSTPPRNADPGAAKAKDARLAIPGWGSGYDSSARSRGPGASGRRAQVQPCTKSRSGLLFGDAAVGTAALTRRTIALSASGADDRSVNGHARRTRDESPDHCRDGGLRG